MTRTLLKFLLPLLLLVFSPSFSLHAQDGGSETSTVIAADDNEDTSDDKKKKKKDKEEENTDATFFTIGLDRFTPAFFTRLLIDLVSMLILIRLIYFPVYKRRDHLFTFFMFNITIFIITNLLNAKSGFSTGAAFGLFAVFSLLRYRTEDISARDMTYLFTVIALGLMSSVNKGNIMEMAIINAIILIAAFLLDGNMLIKTEFIKTVQYENIELIKPERYNELLADLSARTGLNVHKASIGKVDFLRDTATIKVYYHENKNQEHE
jgi:hypothetical protein